MLLESPRCVFASLFVLEREIKAAFIRMCVHPCPVISCSIVLGCFPFYVVRVEMAVSYHIQASNDGNYDYEDCQ